MEIYADTLAEAHEATIDVILSRHKEIDIQTHVDKKEFTLEFEDEDGNPDEIKIKVKYPLKEPQVSKGSKFGPLFTKAYKKQFLTLTPPREDGNHATYTYWNRLEDFPYMDIAMGVVHTSGDSKVSIEAKGDGNGRGFKQITELCKKLSNDPNSRRGVMVTWNPILDSQSAEPPCMNWLQIVIRNNKVFLRVVFRSQDILLGLPENLVGCSALLEYITTKLNNFEIGKGYQPCYTVGTLTLISTIPHIYKKRDRDDFDVMRAHIHALKIEQNWKVRVVE